MKRPAFTLAECLIAMTVLAVAVVGIASVLAATYQQSAGQADTTEALALARMLMEEIAAKPIAPRTTPNQPGWPTQTNRAFYDTIDDFDGYTDSSATLTTTGGIALGVVAADGAAYTRRVSITDGAAPVLAGSVVPPAPGDFKAVTVTVDRPGGPTVSITQVFTKTTAPS
jgi:type II secretory pathway pseudopilin PulG